MSKIKKLVASPAVTIGALALAAILLAFSAIGGTRAALTYYSENYVSTVLLHELGVSLVENGTVVASGNADTSASVLSDPVTKESALLSRLVLNGKEEGENEPFKLGALYQEELAVKNATDQDSADHITQYVRVTVQRYWLKPAGTNEDGSTRWTKSPDLDPDLIHLNFLTNENGNASGWVEDLAAHSSERTVLYYTLPLEPGDTTAPFANTLQIDPKVQVTVEQTTDANGAITNTYVYDDCSFQLEVKVDAVQNHNAADAIRSAWGREVTIGADGTLSLS